MRARGTQTPGLLPISAILAMEPGWKRPDPAVTSSRRLSDERSRVTSQSANNDSDQTRQIGAAAKAIRSSLHDSASNSATGHATTGRQTRIASATHYDSSLPQVTTTVPNRLFKRLIIVIKRLGRGDVSVSDEQLSKVTQQLRQYGLSVYIQ